MSKKNSDSSGDSTWILYAVIAAAGLFLLWPLLGGLGSIFDTAGDVITQLYNAVLAPIVGVAGSVISSIGDGISAVWDGAKSVFSGVTSTVRSAISGVSKFTGGVVDAVGDAVSWLNPFD